MNSSSNRLPSGLRAVDLVKSLLGKGGTTDFQVRQWGIRRTRKSVVPLNQQVPCPGGGCNWQQHRQQYLEEQGWRVLRFSNEEVIEDVEAVAIAIAKSMGLKPTYGPHIEVRSGMRSRRSPNSKKGH